jgi:hypothetical protein
MNLSVFARVGSLGGPEGNLSLTLRRDSTLPLSLSLSLSLFRERFSPPYRAIIDISGEKRG